MSYIGTPPSNAFTSLLKQDFSTSATTGYTLDHAVNNANDIALFINFVRQEPTAGYAASGTTLTLTSATASSDDMYCVYLGQALQTVNPANASVGLSQLTATGTKDATTFLRGDNTFASAGGDNTPMFLVRKASTQDVSDASDVQVTFDTEVIDTDNAFASNTFTVPSGEAGKYLISCQLTMHCSSATTLEFATVKIFKNDTHFINSQWSAYNNPVFYQTPCLTVIMDLSAGDTLKVYTYIDVSSGTPRVLGETSRFATWFQGFKLI